MSSCRQQIPVFVDLACEWEAGRINAFALVTQEKAELADASPALWSTASFYTTEDYVGDIVIHQQVSGGYAGSDTEIAGKGNQQSRVGGKNHEVTMRVESVKGNNAYWNKLGISTNYRAVFVTDDYNLLIVATRNVSISANLILEDSLDSITEWEVKVKWSDISVPETYDVPAGIFKPS
jgi:hypothetical protein